MLPAIFEPFSTPKSERQGLGVGLYIAQQIALAHGGTIHVRSADGLSTFAVELPR